MDRTLTRAERLKSLEAILYRTPGGVTASQVAERLEVHRSTAYRDLRSLAQTGAPVWEEAGRFATVRLDLHEALALYLAARLLAAHSDEHNPHVIAALRKLAGAVPQPMADHMERTARTAGQRQAAQGYVTVLEALTRAWADSRQVEITYRGPRDGAATRRVLDTYFIEPSATGYACYAIGFDHLRQALRTFKVERIHQIELLDSTYEVDPGSTPTTTCRAPGASWAATRAPPCACASTPASPWIRSWGPDCEVLEPEALRREVGQELARAAGRYG